MESLEKLIRRGYEITKDRGLIVEQSQKKTTKQDFYNKICEEFGEVTEALKPEHERVTKTLAGELIDLASVCLNWLIFEGYDVNELFHRNNFKNYNRVK